MKTPRIVNAINNIDDKLISEAVNSKPKSSRLQFKRWTAIAAVFALVLAGGFAAITGFSQSPYATVALDINPSIELEINKNEKVTEINELNEEAKKVIGDMELKGVDLEVAVNAIIGSLLKNGYLSVDQNSILVSVSSKDSEKAKSLQKEISNEISALLSGEKIEASVITQEYKISEEVKKQAEENKISTARAALIEKIIESGLKDAKGEPYGYEQLAELNVNELKVILETKPITVSGIESSGSASDNAYIGREKALAAAYKKAGISEGEVLHTELEMDYEDDINKMLYEIELRCEGAEYEFEIDAISGDILHYEKETFKKPTETTAPAEKPEIPPSTTAAETTKPKPIAETTAEATAPKPTEYIGREKALEAAYAHAGVKAADTFKNECELEREDGIMIYSIEFKTATHEYEYEINAESGKVLKAEKEMLDKDDAHEVIATTAEATAPKPTEYIGREKALEAAYAHAGVKAADTFKNECELEREDGIMVYSIEFETATHEYEYEINAENGKVLKAEKEKQD